MDFESGHYKQMRAGIGFEERFDDATRTTIYISGERSLMWAVFSDGIQSFRHNVAATSTERRLEFLEAEHWVVSNDWDWPLSFVNLCQLFGFNPQSVRRELFRMKGERCRPPLRRQRFRPIMLSASN